MNQNSEDESPPKTIEIFIDGDTTTITPIWSQKNESDIARDPDTGVLYIENEIGEYAPYLLDLPTIDFEDIPEYYKAKETITLYDGTKSFVPVWLQRESGAIMAKDPDTGILYIRVNLEEEYYPYFSYLERHNDGERSFNIAPN